jgi:hypothetical protein
VDPHRVDADPDSDFYLMRIRRADPPIRIGFSFEADPTFHADADTDPDPDPCFHIKAQTLSKLMRIRIQPITLMQIHIFI